MIMTLPDGCGYSGHDFGASYPDTECYGGRLYDMDNCDNDGNLIEPLEYKPCPKCNTLAFLENAKNDAESGCSPPDSGKDEWFSAVRYAAAQNIPETEKAVRSLGNIKTCTVTDDNDYLLVSPDEAILMLNTPSSLKTEFVPRQVIEQQVLVALDDKDKVALILEKKDLDLLITLLGGGPPGVQLTQHRIDMKHDFIKLSRAAFGE